MNMLTESPFKRYKGGTPKSTKPGPLPPPAQQPTEIIAQSAQAGQTKGRRLRKRTSRASTRTTRPSLAFQPAQTQQAGLKTELG